MSTFHEEELSAIGLCELWGEEASNSRGAGVADATDSGSENSPDPRSAGVGGAPQKRRRCSIKSEYKAELCLFQERAYMSRGRKLFVDENE